MPKKTKAIFRVRIQVPDDEYFIDVVLLSTFNFRQAIRYYNETEQSDKWLEQSTPDGQGWLIIDKVES